MSATIRREPEVSERHSHRPNGPSDQGRKAPSMPLFRCPEASRAFSWFCLASCIRPASRSPSSCLHFFSANWRSRLSAYASSLCWESTSLIPPLLLSKSFVGNPHLQSLYFSTKQHPIPLLRVREMLLASEEPQRLIPIGYWGTPHFHVLIFVPRD